MMVEYLMRVASDHHIVDITVSVGFGRPIRWRLLNMSCIYEITSLSRHVSYCDITTLIDKQVAR
jgi:hypothetical protein